MEKAKIQQKEQEAKKKAELEKQEQENRTGREVMKTVGGITSSVVKALNDLDWYTRLYGDPSVNLNVSDFQQGEEVDLGMNVFPTNLGKDPAKGAVTNPGVYKVAWVPTIGNQKITKVQEDSGLVTHVESGINEVISRLKSQLDKRNSRITTYSNDTIGRYFVGTIDGPLAVLKLLGAAIAFYNYADVIYPSVSKKVITALGFKYSDFRANIARYKDLYTEKAVNFNESIVIIDDLNFRKRRSFCTAKIMRDADSRKAQYIVWAPAFVAKLGDSDVVTYIPFADMCYDWMESYLTSELDKWTKGATWRPFVRDLRGSVKEDNFHKIEANWEAVSVQIDVVDEVMAQFHNMRTYPAFPIASRTYCQYESKTLSLSGDSGENLIQGDPDPNTPLGETQVGRMKVGQFTQNADASARAVDLLNKALSGNTAVSGAADPICLNQYKAFSEGDIMIDTRLTATFKVEAHKIGDTNNYLYWVYPSNYGTEVVLSIQVVGETPAGASHPSSSYYADIDTFSVMCPYYASEMWYNSEVANINNRVNLSTFYVLGNSLFVDVFDSAFYMLDYLHHISQASMLDWYPLIKTVYTYQAAYNSQYYNMKFTNGELRDYMFIDPNLLSRLHKQAAVSEFAVPLDIVMKPLADSK